jgi:transcriptional regulator with XRE-family HTH domain
VSFNHRTFRAYLQATLQQSHLSLRDAARASGVSASTLSRLLNGETPDLETFATLAQWLQVDAGAFFDHEQHATPDEASTWVMLYSVCEALEMPTDFTEALVKMVQVLREQKST